MRHGSTLVPLFGAITVLLASSGALGDEYYLSEERLGHRTAPILLLSRADVRTELGLSAEKQASARRTIAEVYNKAETLRGKPDSPEVIAARRSIDQAQKIWIESELTAEQQARLVQLDLQWEGPAALSRPAVAQSLALSETQRLAITAAVAARRKVAPGPTARDADRHLTVTTLTILDDEQKARWRAMIGRPMTFEAARAANTKTARR